MLEEARLVERVIQYGNRYRSTHHSIAQSLEEAEEAFRHYEYKEALKQASAAIEQVDPGALDRIQRIVSSQLKARVQRTRAFMTLFFVYYLCDVYLLQY